eukprot:403331856
MSIFKKFGKSKDVQSSSNSSNSIHTNEEKNKTARLEDQIKHLNSYIQELAKENEVLQDRNNDMRTTLQQNKMLLNDYINTVGQSDQLVQKMKKEMDSLRLQLNQAQLNQSYFLKNAEQSQSPISGPPGEMEFKHHLSGNGHQLNNQNTVGYTTTTKANTTVFYQTSPKNSAFTQYNLTTIVDHQNNLQSINNHNNNHQQQQQQNPINKQKNQTVNQQQQIQVQCPKCQLQFRTNLPTQIQHQNSNNQVVQEQMAKKQQDLQKELEMLRNELMNLMKEKSNSMAFENQSDDANGGMNSQRSYNGQQLESYRAPAGRESTVSNRRLHTLSQMFVDKNHKDLSKIQEMLENSQLNNELILFTDSRGSIWQIIQREDLQSFNNMEDNEESQRDINYQQNNGIDGLISDMDGKQIMISHPSDYEDEEDNGTGGQDDDDDSLDSDGNQISDRNQDHSQRKRQAEISKLQNDLSNQKNNALISSHSKSNNQHQSNSKNNGNISNQRVSGNLSQKQRQTNQQDADDKNVMVSVLNTLNTEES